MKVHQAWFFRKKKETSLGCELSIILWKSSDNGNLKRLELQNEGREVSLRTSFPVICKLSLWITPVRKLCGISWTEIIKKSFMKVHQAWFFRKKMSLGCELSIILWKSSNNGNLKRLELQNEGREGSLRTSFPGRIFSVNDTLLLVC